MKNNVSIVDVAKKFAIDSHKAVNHTYDGKPYETHLELTMYYAKKFEHLIVGNPEIVFVACWAHDTIADCRLTYNDVKFILGVEVADIVYALTNEKGKTREERANEKYYNGIINTKDAVFVKVCDRLANIKYSKDNNSSMFFKYMNENKSFLKYFKEFAYGHLNEMFLEIENLLDDEIEIQTDDI